MRKNLIFIIPTSIVLSVILWGLFTPLKAEQSNVDVIGGNPLPTAEPTQAVSTPEPTSAPQAVEVIATPSVQENSVNNDQPAKQCRQVCQQVCE